MVLECFDVGGQPIQFVDRAGQRRTCLGQQVGKCRGSVVERLDRLTDRIAMGCQLSDELMQTVDCRREVVAVLRERADRRVEVVDQLLNHLIVVSQLVGKRRRVREQGLQGTALALQHLQQ